jgi:outer membrane protein TolC
MSMTRVAAFVGAALACAALAGGCSGAHYRRSADREVYSIIEAKTGAVPGMPEAFTIEQPAGDALAGCPVVEVGPLPGEAGWQEESAPTRESALLSLAKALEVAAVNSRDYQREREDLYLSALSLTLSRHAFAPVFSGSVSGEYSSTDLGEEEEIRGRTDFGLSWLFRTGTLVTASLATDLSRILTHNPEESATSLLSLRITQPLLQGAGIAVYEPLTQAERDVIYDMRDFVRYRRRFFVDVLSDYYDVLRERQVLENERVNYENLIVARERAEWLGQAGRLPPFQVDQTRQDELRAADRFAQAYQRYLGQLDRFKLTLALPTETPVELDARELEALAQEVGAEPVLDVERAVAVALESRLDLATSRDELDDADRKVRVARNDLLPGLDLSASLSADSLGDQTPLRFALNKSDFTAGFELDLPLDRKSERNEYRRRLIQLDQAGRNHTELRDQVVLDVRDAWRSYERAQRTFDIQKASLELAERRVESTMMLLDAGRADTRDMLDAREALLSAQNALAGAMVEYRVARLALARDMGVLAVGDKGELEENLDEYI